MKRTSKQPLFYSLTALTVLTSGLAYAEVEVTAPNLEGGVTASLGALYLVPSADGQDYAATFHGSEDDEITRFDGNFVEVNPGYDFGFEASLGYLFDNTANGIELYYRGINTNDSDSISRGLDAPENEGIFVPLFNGSTVDAASSDLSYELNAADLMINQFMDIGNAVQMRFSVGASYLNLEKEQTGHFVGFDGAQQWEIYAEELVHGSQSQFSGFGPRFAADARYELGEGFGLLGGASFAYYIGDMDVSDTFVATFDDDYMSKSSDTYTDIVQDNINNHSVTNLRGNIGIDYVYFFEEDEDFHAFGIELGYLVDYYADALQQLNYSSNG
ncbi:MAG TPA: Lpg1974 family pore-forming outer membrane protein, partial [Gammaproteobacteria bacterium]|nr:Lpg1974 family pore-forming outer membrane protein [Gammaproteobacteria bacterium]